MHINLILIIEIYLLFEKKSVISMHTEMNVNQKFAYMILHLFMSGVNKEKEPMFIKG